MGIVAALTEIAQAIGELFVNLVSSIGGIFFEATTSNTAGFIVTPIGYVALLGLAMSIAYFILRWVTSLVKRKN